MGDPGLPLPAAASDQAGCAPHRPWGHRLLLWTALLFLAPSAGTSGLPKAVLSLQPPWLQVFPEEDVTLSCQGPRSPGDNSTRWFHNGTAIPAQAQPRYSFKASSSHRGAYRCQTGQTSLSDPVHLDVTSDWLLLQTTRLLVPQGDPIVLRCHSWRNWRLYKITFFLDGKPKWFSHWNSSLSIPHANASHSGAYHCSGFLGQTLHSSPPVSITVPESSERFLLVVVGAVIASIVAVAGVAGVTWVCFRRHQNSVLPPAARSLRLGPACSVRSLRPRAAVGGAGPACGLCCRREDRSSTTLSNQRDESNDEQCEGEGEEEPTERMGGP